MEKKVYVKNFPFSATEEDIKNLFTEFGAVESVKIIRDGRTGDSKGFGFVEMETEADAKKAITGLDGRVFLGRTLTVAEAKPQQPKFGGFDKKRGGGFGGGGRGPGRGWR
ncbi:MAG: RNA recognition motif domain-containing protein [Chloroflexota bacterium]